MAPKTQAKKNLKLMFILYITFLRSISNILYFPDNDNVRIQTSTAINNITVYMVKLNWIHIGFIWTDLAMFFLQIFSSQKKMLLVNN